MRAMLNRQCHKDRRYNIQHEGRWRHQFLPWIHLGFELSISLCIGPACLLLAYKANKLSSKAFPRCIYRNVYSAALGALAYKSDIGTKGTV